MWLGFCTLHMSKCAWGRQRQKTQFTNMKYVQGEWVTCRQYSILIFQYKSPFHLKCYILIQTPSQLYMWLQRYEQFFEVQKKVKHKHLSFVLACNSKSIFPTSNSFSWIMSQVQIWLVCYTMFHAEISSGKWIDWIKDWQEFIFSWHGWVL